MGVEYRAVLWNRHKRIYDRVLLLGVLVYLIAFTAFNLILHPQITPETLIIRGTSTLALLLLHIILLIGPLSRIDKRFLPLLYNRRHLGVSMFLIALIHGVFSIIQFHAGGDIPALLSLFTTNTHYDSFVNFPFQVLGFFALLILFVMAATSHDFWLNNLGPRFWKAMHMMVYIAYALIVMHVMLGVVQLERSPVLVSMLGLGVVSIITTHLIAAFKASRSDMQAGITLEDNYTRVCEITEIAENRAKVITVGDESIAVFKYDGKLSAVSNVCKHQNGPLGEGKIVDGCITCPWHGYQYLPHNGQSPPPFTEKVSTYRLKIMEGVVWVDPNGLPEGTELEPLKIEDQ